MPPPPALHTPAALLTVRALLPHRLVGNRPRGQVDGGAGHGARGGGSRQLMVGGDVNNGPEEATVSVYMH